MRELLIVYDGPGLSGRTTSIQCLHSQLRGSVLSFGLRGIELQVVAGDVRLCLVVPPAAALICEARERLRDAAAAFVIVLDSQEPRLEADRYALEAIHASFARAGERPTVVQYNKRDLRGVLAIDELARRLGIGASVSFESIATRGEGIWEPFVLAARLGAQHLGLHDDVHALLTRRR